MVHHCILIDKTAEQNSAPMVRGAPGGRTVASVIQYAYPTVFGADNGCPTRSSSRTCQSCGVFIY